MNAFRWLASCLFGCAAAAAVFANPPRNGKTPAKPQAEIQFNRDIRPIFANHCFQCHGPDVKKGGLDLQSFQSATRDLKSGHKAIVPGNSAASKLIERVAAEDEDQRMPPRSSGKKLSLEEIHKLRAWIDQGARYEEHWAFVQPTRTEPPREKIGTRPGAGIDYFIRLRLEEAGLTFSPEADRRTLVRRATFDLIGLPPTPEEIAEAQNDQSPEWFEKVIDRLLASPRYGERWGRHWLDVARYSDTKGYVFNEDRRYPYAYTYRDYVIRAFNNDLPYDRFIIEQLAADQLPLGADKGPLAAMGFLTLGRRFLNNQNDIIDDRIDVTMRGLQGLTVTCARCHDHKYDPIPTQDYYSLYGVFASCTEPKDLPMLGTPREQKEYAAYFKELRAREQKVADFLQEQHQQLQAQFRSQAAEYMLAAYQADHGSTEDVLHGTTSELNPVMKKRWRAYLDRTRTKAPADVEADGWGEGAHPIFAPWHAFAALPPKEFAARAELLATKTAANEDGHIHPLVARAFVGEPPQSLRDVAQRYGKLLREADRLWQEALQQAKEAKKPAPKALADAHQESLRQVLHGADAPARIEIKDLRAFFLRPQQKKLTELEGEVRRWKATAAADPPRAMVLVDAPRPVRPRVFIRGNPGNKGEEVPRQFLRVLSGKKRWPFEKGSGRLELARAIASKDNPLTARVMVNRVWMHHFGAGLVRTPGDFGTRGEPPTHPELLDYLANHFMDNGWSVKKLHREIMLSRTYRQSSADNPRGLQADPGNRLHWKMNRQRLDFEATRDAMLAVAGTLDTTMGGKAVDITKKPFSKRRTVYAYIERQNLPGVFRTFDFATPDLCTTQRSHTTVPQQALFLMNSPFVVEQAEHLARRCAQAAGDDPTQRVHYLYRLLFGRMPSEYETRLGLRFVEDSCKQAMDVPGLWARYAQVLMLSNEFVFVD